MGLLVFENRLKNQTKHTIAEPNAGKLRLIMITGLFRTSDGTMLTIYSKTGKVEHLYKLNTWIRLTCKLDVGTKILKPI